MKKWYESKLIWYNVVMTIVDVATFLMTTVQGLPDWLMVALTIIHGFGNILIRVWFTNKAIEV